MRHSPPQHPQFYVTAPQDCPYLENKVERKLFTALYGSNSSRLNNSLSKQGFRRSQNVLYRPSCSNCSACMSARIPSKDFSPSKSQKRILSKNEDIVRVINPPLATDPQYELFKNYISKRHSNGGMSDMDSDDFTSMIEESNVESKLIEYYIKKDATLELVSFSLVDILDDGVSMVYSVFDPELRNRSLGTYMILDHNRLALEMTLKFVYLGYWVKGSSKMDYKKRFSPLEVFTEDKWTCSSKVNHTKPNSVDGSKDKLGVPIYLPSDQ
jgi:arginine-tRNA-protein transferase